MGIPAWARRFSGPRDVRIGEIIISRQLDVKPGGGGWAGGSPAPRKDPPEQGNEGGSVGVRPWGR